MDTQIVEILGRNVLIAQLVAAGIEVALPIRDRGVDLIVYAELAEYTKRFSAVPIQMKAASKASFGINRKYERITNLILTYVWGVRQSTEAAVFALTYAQAVAVARKVGYTETPSWTKDGYYVNNNPGKNLRGFLEPYRMSSERWRQVVFSAKRHA